jgi:hypothetical protein
MITHHLLMGVVTLLPLAAVLFAIWSATRKIALWRQGVRVLGRALWVWREEEALPGGTDGEDHVIVAFKDSVGRENRIRKLGLQWYFGVKKRGEMVALIYPPNQPTLAALSRPLYFWSVELCVIVFAVLIVLARAVTGV